MKTALFVNFTNEAFTGYWDGKGKTFKSGQSLYMPEYLARHFAKHLVNRELLSRDKNGNLVFKDGEKLTSPKKPEESPIFMELFNKAYIPDEDEEALGDKQDDIDTLIDVANKNRSKRISNRDGSDDTDVNPAKTSKVKQDPKKPQIIDVPESDDDEDDEDEKFEGKNNSKK